jgi:hypothetical protein
VRDKKSKYKICYSKEVMLKSSAKSEQLSPLGLKGICNLVFGRGWGGGDSERIEIKDFKNIKSHG